MKLSILSRVAWIVALSLPTAARAQDQQVSGGQLLQGTWTLVRAEVIRSDGTRDVDSLYGADAKGLLMVDRQGRYSLQIFRPDRPRFAAGDRIKGTPAEYEAAVIGISTHVGRIAVDTVDHTLLFHIDRASFPNSENTDQKRTYRLVNDELSYTVPPRPDGSRAVSVWRRVD